MNEQSLNPEEIKEIILRAQELGLKGFGGRCAGVALAMNEVLFKGQGTLVIAVNEYLWLNHKHFAGHVVVKYQDLFWDADARAKSFEDIDDWGDISQDNYYREKFKEYGSRWTEKRATTTALFELDDVSELPWGHDEVPEYIPYFTQALAQFLSSK